MRQLFLMLCLVLMAGPVFAETVEVVPGTFLEFSLPNERWQHASEPPTFLVDKTAAHLDPNMKKMIGSQTMSSRDVALKILSANELFIYNAASEAFLAVDFSPLREGEDAPSRRTIAASARLAGESLANEEGLSDVVQDTSKTRIDGADYAYRLDAGFHKHGDDIRFIGITGFAEPHWFYLYYTDYNQSSQDLAEMETLLKTVRIFR